VKNQHGGDISKRTSMDVRTSEAIHSQRAPTIHHPP
jgi:hypothetical protein